MEGALAQCVAIALHGSAWLALAEAARGLPPRLIEENSTFQYVSSVRFEDHTGQPVADDVGTWLVYLASIGATEIGLWLPDVAVEPPDGPLPWHVQVSFAGGSPAGLLVAAPGGGQLWSGHWRVTDARRRRLWQVTYQRAPMSAPLLRPPLDSARRELIAAIDRAIDFARTHDMQPWDETLAHARDLDSAEQPEPPYHADMVPPGRLGRPRRRLLAMATGAHVFGGMGSWNDFLFADDVRGDYDAVSHRLFAAVMRAFSASVNTPDPAS